MLSAFLPPQWVGWPVLPVIGLGGSLSADLGHDQREAVGIIEQA